MSTCTYSSCHEIAPRGFARCDAHRQLIRERAAARRRKYKLAGKCPRDGRALARGKKLCKQCLKDFAALHRERYQRRLSEGVCPKCGSPKRARRKLADGTTVITKECAACLGLAQHEYRKADSSRRLRLQKRRKRRKPTDADRAANATRYRRWRARMRAAGRCEKCRRACDINPATGQPYSRCRAHR